MTIQEYVEHYKANKNPLDKWDIDEFLLFCLDNPSSYAVGDLQGLPAVQYDLVEFLEWKTKRDEDKKESQAIRPE